MADDIKTGPLQVAGLRQAAENMQELAGPLRLKIAREAMHSASGVLADRVRANSYQTFKKITGAIGAGLSLAAGQQLKGNILFGVVGEFPVAAAGQARKFNVKKMMKAGKGSQVPLYNVAYWWLFLELGTGLRTAKPTPKTKKHISLRPGTRSTKRWAAYLNAPYRGRVTPRPWVARTAAANGQAAILAFGARFKGEVETEISKLPK